ncbi:MAG TPA: SseB family protein [Gammaproteobacteria bacterium]|jgi:hypothetical protein|nr:SseB family protein [Gammaproteobacteria bacterium]
MTTENQTLSPLEKSLASFEDTVEGRKAVLQAFLGARVFVLLDRPWDGRSLPSTEIRMLFVSDGENQEQAMLAVFTDRGRAETVMAGMGEFNQPVEVDAQWALLGVPPSVGVRINPNVEPSFRILPELTIELRKIAEQTQAQRRAGAAR